MSFCRYDDNDTEGGFQWGGTPDDDDDGCSPLSAFLSSFHSNGRYGIRVRASGRVRIRVRVYIQSVCVPVSGMMTTMMLMGQ